ncbi:hypothetical protein DK926_18980 [Rhodococcus sp. Eu-32]|uniref:DUF7572 family protein n=1 Tax=Rhodococcus sp. Eu-32 TaxID=1017319 RepID=UPI000DF3558D|nr:hypothetical protein [Rhodococcus sp. Eu-32]RRQ26327.1 hypothetical protein DK926_18980 [Rhodococcus sp. Eu-32]
MATATLVEESMSWWQPGTNLYRLSEPFQGKEYVAVTVAPTGTAVMPATESGASVAAPNEIGLVAYRSEYPPIPHDEMLQRLGYQVK